MSDNKEDKIPEMPKMPTNKESESPDGGSDSGPEDLNIPSHKEDKPSIIDPGKVDSKIDLPSAPKSGIEVVAVRKGFFNQQRVEPGVKFIIRSEKQFGDWFECIDPLYEKKRKEFYKYKKARR